MNRSAIARLMAGGRESLPIALGYAPLAFAFGVLAGQAGLPPAAAIAMSAVVYTGAGQFIAVAMLAQGAGVGAIWLTTTLMSLRHLLLGASLVQRLQGVPRRVLAALAFQVTDETFVVATGDRLKKPDGTLDPWELGGLQLGAYASWVGGSAVGALSGGRFDAAGYLDFALPAMFVALLVLSVRWDASLFAAVVAGLAVWALGTAVSPYWVVPLATLLGILGGVMVQRWSLRR